LRGFNRLLGVAMGLALVGAGGFCAFEVVLAAFGHSFLVLPAGAYLRALRTTRWSALPSRAIVAAVAAAGLLLFVAEAWPRRPRLLPFPASDGAGRWWVLRTSMERHLRRRVVESTPAQRARVRLRVRRQRWQARVKTVASLELRPEIAEVAHQGLSRLGAPEATTIKVKVTRPKRVA
jgi:hypothetical protein